MRRLAILSFSFVSGACLAVLGLSGMLLAAAACVLAAAVVLCLLLRPRTRKIILLSVLGLLVGFAYTVRWRQVHIDRPEEYDGAVLPCEITLTSVPNEASFGFTANGRVSLGGEKYRVKLYFSGEDGENFLPGTVLAGTGTFSKADDAEENLGYYRSVGIPLFVSLKGWTVISTGQSASLRYAPARMAAILRQRIEALFPEDVSALLTALFTGDKSGLTYGQKTDLKLAGNYHALAVSGMHVSILMSMVYTLSLRNRKLYPLFGIPILAFYCMMTGLSSGVVRASVMYLFLMLAPVFNRESDPPTAMGTSLLCLTVANPWCLVNVGLLLSYGACAGILLFAEPLQAVLFRFGKHPSKGSVLLPAKKFFATSAATTVSALVFTLPVSLVTFGIIPVLSVLTNLLTLWAITWIFTLGLLSVGLSFLWWGGAKLLALPVTWLLRYVLFVSGKIAALPFAALYPGESMLAVWYIAAAVFLLLLLWRRKALTKRFALLALSGWIFLSSGTLLWSITRYSRDFATFTVLDVGQGQCLLLESGGCTAAIDCGGSDGDTAGELLAEELLSRGYTSLDLLIFTHYDTDHIGGTEQLLHRIPVATVLLPDIPDSSGKRDALESLALQSGAAVLYVKSRASLDFGNGALNLLPPAAGETANESCLAVLASFDSYDILVTGDLPTAQEQTLLETYPMKNIEVLVAGHHGSKSSTSEYLLNQITPDIVVISVGENLYGHPNGETLQRIAASGAVIYRTDRNGTVTIRR